MLGLVQIQGLGRHPALVRIVQPVLMGLAVGATLLKLSLMHVAQQRTPAAGLDAALNPTESANPAYLSGEWREREEAGAVGNGSAGLRWLARGSAAAACARCSEEVLLPWHAADLLEHGLPAHPADCVIAIVQLISANYMGQHTFLEDMTGMQSPATFQV